MPKSDQQSKHAYFTKVHDLFRTHRRIIVANIDNVASSQMHQIRQTLRGKATILVCKNTMVRKALNEIIDENPKWKAMIPLICGNIGLVFTNEDLKHVRDIMVSNKKQSAAKVGLIAQNDIYIPAGNTGIDPNKTGFFQALGISTKVVKGAIEIATDVLIIKTGQKVGPSEAALLNMLNLVPFSFGLSIVNVYDDGSIISPKMLDITDEVLIGHMMSAIRNVTACSLATGCIAVPAVPHLIFNAYKNILAVGMESQYSFPEFEKIKEALKSSAASSAAASKSNAGATEAKAAPVAVAAKEESDEEMGMGLFD